MRYHAPYMEWAKTRPSATFDLAGSNVLGCSIEELEGAEGALGFAGRNDNGYEPLVAAIAQRYGVAVGQVTTATGTSGANFLVCAALLEPGDEVLVERPGYDPLLGAPRLLGARANRFDRAFEEGFALNPDRVRRAMTPRTRLVIVTNPHNPSGVLAPVATLQEIGRIAEAAGATVLVDEVYLDAVDTNRRPSTALGPPFVTTSSLTKSYGLAGLRCGWTLSSAALAERIRRARDVVDGTGSIVAERLSVLAFDHLDRLIDRSRRLLDANWTVADEFFVSRGDLEYVPPGGGTVLFPRIRGVAETGSFAKRLLSARDTAIVPGRFFDAPAHFRIGFGGATDSLREGLRRLGAALDAREF